MAVREALRRTLAITLLAAGILGICTHGAALPRLIPGEFDRSVDVDAWAASIERQPICVGSTVASVGKLGDTLYYRSSRQDDGRLSVGYYAFFSDERPWGNNWLTWTVLPALVLDIFYTHSLFFAPGLQRAVYGKGDVEGFRIVYDIDDQGRLITDYGAADSGRHAEVRLARSDLLSIEPWRPTVYSAWWSHQLGARGATSSELVYRHCYGPTSIRELPPRLATEFHLDRRALPARVGAVVRRRPFELDAAPGEAERRPPAEAGRLAGMQGSLSTSAVVASSLRVLDLISRLAITALGK